MNVGETSPAGFCSKTYRWGATEDKGEMWAPDTYFLSNDTIYKLDADHDIATITWGEKWHVPSREEWTLLIEQCDYKRKEASESGYGVAGYFFYNKSDYSKFIFLPVSTWSNELEYWTSEQDVSITAAYTFNSYRGNLHCYSTAGINSTGFAIRPVFVE